MEKLFVCETLNMQEILMKHKNFFYNNPEEGFKEFKTSQYISKVLKDLGYEVEVDIAGTGVLGVMRGSGDKEECILFRSEMDALLVDGEDGNEKWMHVCGHDAHMAINLALAEIISHNKQKLKGDIKFLFQPAEEKINGAKEMIKAGVLTGPKVTKIFGLHVWSEFQVGEVAVSDSFIMAGGDEFSIDVLGNGGHAAMPNKSIDTIVISANIINLIQSIMSRSVNPLEKGVITIGTINGGKSKNTIAEITKMSGTCRYFSKEVQDTILEMLNSITTHTSKAFNSNIKLNYIKNVPPIRNNKEIADDLRELGNSIFGAKNIIYDYSSMCVDDFSFYLDEVEGCFVLLGCRENEYFPQHNTNYYVPLKAMELGLEYEYSICKHYLF